MDGKAIFRTARLLGDATPFRLFRRKICTGSLRELPLPKRPGLSRMLEDRRDHSTMRDYLGETEPAYGLNMSAR